MPRLRYITALRIATAATLAEILLITVWTLRKAPPEAALYAGVLWTLVKCGPLLVLLPPLVRGSTRAAVWLCFVLCAYFLAAVIDAMSPPPVRWLGVLEIIVISAAFTAALLGARWGRGMPEPPLRMS